MLTKINYAVLIGFLFLTHNYIYSQCLSFTTASAGEYFNASNWENNLLPPNPIPTDVTVNVLHNMTISQTLENNGNIIAASIIISNFGELGGSGTIIGNLQNNGQISPGAFPTASLPNSLPGVITLNSNNITSNEALIMSEVCYEGSFSLLNRGVCYDVSPNPTIINSVVASGNGIGPFSIIISGLIPNTTYYVRSFASNNMGTSYGKQLSFTTLPGPTTGIVTDIDGNTYTTRLMADNKWWMTQNLNTGVMIPGLNNPANNSITEKYCYNNDMSNCTNYGALYQWDEMMLYSTTQGIQGICPSGWHLPTDAEYKNLEMALGMSLVDANDFGLRGSNQGSQLSYNEPFWTNGQLDTNPAFGSSNFNTIPVGARGTGAIPFFNLSIDGSYWTSTQDGFGGALMRSMIYYSSEVNRSGIIKEQGFSVRCVMN